MSIQDARNQIAEMYAQYGNWRLVGEALANGSGNSRSLAALANRAYNGGAVTPLLMEALGMKKKRFRRAIEFDTAEDAELFDRWVKDQGHASATAWFKAKVWELY